MIATSKKHVRDISSRHMKLSVDLPENHSGLKLRIESNGAIKLLDSNDNEVKPTKSTRLVFEKKPHKEKHLTRMEVADNILSIGGFEELCKLDSFFVLDTSTKIINNTRISVTFLMRIKLYKEPEGYRAINRDTHAFFFEFHGIPESENPEMFAILKLANDVLRTEAMNSDIRIGIITDSDMANHFDISNQKLPIYKDMLLPSNFDLIYAKDKGGDVTNQLIGFCDKQASRKLKEFELGIWGGKQLKSATEDSDVSCTCHPVPIEQFDMGLLKESTGSIGEIEFYG
jgi:hypothetical protein